MSAGTALRLLPRPKKVTFPFVSSAQLPTGRAFNYLRPIAGARRWSKPKKWAWCFPPGFKKLAKGYDEIAKGTS